MTYQRGVVSFCKLLTSCRDRSKQLDYFVESKVHNADNDSGGDKADQPDKGLFYRVLARGPDDLLAFAFEILQELDDTAGFLFLHFGRSVLFACHDITSFLYAFLFAFLVKSVLPAESAVFLQLKSVRVVLLVFNGVIVSLLAFTADHGDLNSHCFIGTSIIVTSLCSGRYVRAPEEIANRRLGAKTKPHAEVKTVYSIFFRLSIFFTNFFHLF